MASDVCVQFGLRIRQLRKDRKWRQLDLATHAGINENYVSDLERGQKEPCLRMLATLASAFEIKLGELLRDLE